MLSATAGSPFCDRWKLLNHQHKTVNLYDDYRLTEVFIYTFDVATNAAIQCPRDAVKREKRENSRCLWKDRQGFFWNCSLNILITEQIKVNFYL